MSSVSIVLIGYRGSGKTTIGRRLADKLWQKFVDTDDLIIQKAGGKSIADIFAQEGETHFRDLEVQAVREASQLADHVIAIGGGALMREENRDVLKTAGHKLIYLKCDPKQLQKRINADPQTAANRPALTAHAGSVKEIRQLLEQREPIYRQCMHAELDVTNLTPDEAVVYIVRML
jgi:shikimate kinase